MPVYKVTATIQSPGNDPVTIPWYSGPDLSSVFVSVGQNLEDHSGHPLAVPVRSVHIEVTPTPGPTHYLKCEECGEVFDDLAIAAAHDVTGQIEWSVVDAEEAI